ncbi:MAG TPA: flagellar hook-associated protein FlgK [Phycisphaerae bacterium]|jgi:flagellar hook-associated protein 1 FlgK|nr:flagellar hook-associated protein FlgK [Phycisphaerae bacterium]HOJ55051.1 flagellar hook-associated protein FlgK [Phycisphaerae bacterium]HOL27792.1 flagellar hook-associated protein FlgK [Phycisphaerae bacterium]HPP22001.1 flagellar hook-associated protein FlgK [Phycisphaerae bacterium]HPU33671.1 flagellar hook-associated protein FlgK [Phycisphaerae bacterium]
MGLVTSALTIGRSALLAYQSALQVIGNNVANAGSASYTRQTAVLTPARGVPLSEGFLAGGGVTLDALKRNIDNALENRIRYSLSDQSNALAQQQALGRVESILNELSEVDLSTLMQRFFNAFGALQNQAHDGGAREMVLAAADALISEIGRQRTDLFALRDDLNVQIEDAARTANDLAAGIAQLNTQIVTIESTGQGGANALRDRRDDLLRQLSELIQIEIREQPNGSVNVYVGNEPLVQHNVSRGITAQLDLANGEPRMVVRFADDNGPLALRGGQITGLVVARDTHVMGYMDALDGFAAALIREVNIVHSQGQGLEGQTQVTGTYGVLDPTAALNTQAAGLPFAPRNGSFQINIRDQAGGATQTITITVDLDGIGTDDSLESLVAQINAKAGNLSASVTADYRLQLNAAEGFEFTFAEDSAHVLAALGVNTFFTGSDAKSMAVNDVLRGNLNLLAAATSPAEGDGSNAGALAALATRPLASLNGRSLTEHYNTIATQLGATSAAVKSSLEAADVIAFSLSAQRESISGVSLDEETISMLRLERAFQGAARYSATVDRLIEEMLQLAR